jgi:decaprenylphospho-beta-D-erythro-pentofuranosid-2-ulose 2-reductase
MLQRAIVVGASSGIGAALVRRLVREGCRVVAVARRQEALDAVCREADQGVGEPRALPLVHDVTDVAGARAAFERAVGLLDGLDVVVYCAGVMPRITEEDYDTALDKTTIDINLTGAMAWLNPAAERLKLQGGGTLVGIGSVAGDRGRRGNPAYCASKAALHTYLEALRNRLDQHGVRVVTIKPGPVDTPMTKGRDKLPLLIDADKAADRIAAALRGGPDTRYVPVAWWPIMTAVRSIPSMVFRKMDL